MDYRILGPLEAEREDRPLAVTGRKPRALLALLLLHPNETVPTDRLIDDLWGERPPATAANTLQVYVSKLRKLLADRLVTEGAGYALRVEPDELDAARFERIAEQGRAALTQRSYGEAAERLHEALALWRGPALADLRYEPFAQAEITRLEELRLAAVEDRIEAELFLGRHDQLVADRVARDVLVGQRGREPGPELRELEQAILRQDESLARRPLPASNLPVPASTLVGRARELGEICDRLRRGEVRLVTLTGAGGAGKTRLALEAANAVAPELPDGAFFVALEAIRDPALLLPAIAQVAAVREGSEQPLLESLRDRLTGRRALILLDNFEQLADAAPLLAEVLAAAPGVSFLVTSRTALRLSGEHEYPVHPLGLDDAVALFVERAQSADPGFRLTDEDAGAVAEVCERLSRGPRDLPPRHQALRNTIAWSYDLLDASEQSLFSRLSVFAGGCTLESAVAVGDASLDEIATLIDGSLIERRPGADGALRFQMLETIGEYALERLEAGDEADAVRRRHAEHCLKHAEADPVPNQAAWLAGLDAERDNLRAALDWCRDAGEAGLGLRLAAALWEFWWVRGYLGEGRQRLEDALEQGRRQQPELRARALHAAASLATRQGDYDRAAKLSEQSLALWKKLGNPAGMASSLLSLGTVASEHGDHERAMSLSERAAELYSETDDRRGHALAVSNLGSIALERGEYAQAAALSEQAFGLL